MAAARGEARDVEPLLPALEQALRDFTSKHVVAQVQRARAMAFLTMGRLDSAIAAALSALESQAEMGERFEIVKSCDVAAQVAVAGGRYRGACRLWGVADALRSQLSAPQWPIDLARLKRERSAVEDELGTSNADELRRDGQAMTWTDALRIASALQD